MIAETEDNLLTQEKESIEAWTSGTTRQAKPGWRQVLKYKKRKKIGNGWMKQEQFLNSTTTIL